MDSTLTIYNQGCLDGKLDLSGSLITVIVNHGTIKGDILLGTGNDVFITRDGSSIDGSIDAGDGEDFLDIWNKADLRFSSNIFTAGTSRFENFETIQLIEPTGSLLLNDNYSGSINSFAPITIASDVSIKELTTQSTTVNLGTHTLHATGRVALYGGSLTVIIDKQDGAWDHGKLTAVDSVLISTLNIKPLVPAYVKLGNTTFTIIESESGIITDTSGYATKAFIDANVLVVDTALLDFEIVYDEATHMTIGIRVVPKAVLPGTPGLSSRVHSNYMALKQAFDNGIDTALGIRFQAMSTSELEQAMEEIGSETSPEATFATLAGLDAAANTVQQRLAMGRSGSGMTGLSSGDKGLDMELWTQGFGTRLDKRAHGGAAGYDGRISGFTLGLDRKFSELKLGLAYSYVDSKTKTYNSLNQTETETNLFTLYGEHDTPRWYLNGMIYYGLSSSNSDRNLPLVGRSASGSFDGYQVGTGAEAGYKYGVGKWMFTPFAGLDYTYLHTDDYEESGAGAANLSVSSIGMNMLGTILGAKAEYACDFKNGMLLVPSARVRWMHELLDEKTGSAARFADIGAPLASNTATSDLDHFALSAGMKLHATGALTVSFEYDFNWSSHTKIHTGMCNISYMF